MAKEEKNTQEGKQCSFKDCDVLILPHWEQRSGTNFTYWVDLSTKNKSFVHRHNHEGFKGFAGHTHASANGSSSSPELSRLVLGELEDAGASAASLAIAERLIEVASGKHAAPAISALDRLAARIGEGWAAMKPPGPDETCKLCKRRVDGSKDVHITISPGVELEQRQMMQNLMDAVGDDDGDE